MRGFRIAAVTAALVLASAAASAAHAQAGGGGGGGGSAPAPAPANPSSPADIMRGPDDRLNELNRLGYDAARPGRTRSRIPVPVAPADIVAGSEVRDARGEVMATIESVGKGFAVVASPTGGKIEVEFASFAKNHKGLLINMRKDKFDAMLAGKGKAAE
jgi:hypothetical protein